MADELDKYPLSPGPGTGGYQQYGGNKDLASPGSHYGDDKYPATPGSNYGDNKFPTSPGNGNGDDGPQQYRGGPAQQYGAADYQEYGQEKYPSSPGGGNGAVQQYGQEQYPSSPGDGNGDVQQYGQERYPASPGEGVGELQQGGDEAFEQNGAPEDQSDREDVLEKEVVSEFPRNRASGQPDEGTSAKAALQRNRWPPLAQMMKSGEIKAEPSRVLTPKEKFDVWMVNEGFRRVFVFVFGVMHLMIFTCAFLNFQLKDSLSGARDTFGLGYSFARSAALVLHVDIGLLLFPVCRTLVSLARQTPLNGIIQFDKNITFHKLIGYSLVFFTWVHTISHWSNFAKLAIKNKLGFKGFLLANFATGPGWSGYVMLICLMVIFATSIEKPRRANFERFWYLHHLFIVFFVFWSVHGAFCMIKPDREPFCQGIGVFWQFWMYGGFLYLVERILREVRGRHATFVSKVVQHPSNVCEIQIKKENTKTRAGQYIFLCCPEVSVWQYHPFTLTSAPEEDYISIHVRCVGDFTKALAKSLGCNFEQGSGSAEKNENGTEILGLDNDDSNNNNDARIRKILPRVYIDGPFGSASEDVFKYEVAVLVGAGIGVTPFASILKSIWYRLTYPQMKSRLRKVYFFWVCRDFGSFEWFRSLLMAIEAQDLAHSIEIHTFLTAKIKADDANNIMLNETDNDSDAVTGLRAPTNFCRPNWDMVFRCIRKIHSPAEAGVFFCGPKVLGSLLHIKCNMYSDPDFNFVWGKENF